MRRYQLHFILAFIVLCAFACVYLAFGYVPARASLKFGPPAASLSISDRIEYATRLLSYGDSLSVPLNPNGAEQIFHIDQGETVASIAARLEADGFIFNAQAFYDYMVYTGLDFTLQAGDYNVSPALSIIDIANTFQDPTSADVTFVILPGWRMEEIAASLPTSGLTISPEEFLAAAQTPPQVLAYAAPATMEGYFFPDSYILPRTTSTADLLDIVARNFANHITQDLLDGFAAQGMTINQAVILASIVQREAVHADEQPSIASVFLNRLNAGMSLGGDPTVQYALGYNAEQQTWWTNPLSTADLQIDSPYNTYIYTGLPPMPISNPSFDALHAVAYPVSTGYYYFRAACDGSGYHVYAVTLEEQVANACP